MTENLNFSVKGHFELSDMKSGRILVSKPNLVVNTAKTIITNALVGHPSGDYISFMGFGEDSTPAVISDRVLWNQVYQVACGYDNQPVPYFEDFTEIDGSVTQSAKVTFSCILDESVVSSGISEAGLFSSRQFMFSRITFAPQVKDGSQSWLVRWTLNIRIS